MHFFLLTERDRLAKQFANLWILSSLLYEALENVLCDVIKIRLKRRDEGRRRKGTPNKEMALYVFL